MGKLLLTMWLLMIAFHSGAQELKMLPEEFKPGVSLAVNVSQWLVGQHQVEIEQRVKNSPYAFSMQAFGGQMDRRMVHTNGSDRDTLHGVSTVGVGIGIRRYEQAKSAGLYSQLSIFYKDVTKTYSRLDVEDTFMNYWIFGSPRATYMQSSDRLTGFGLELLGGYRYLHEYFFIEAQGGIVSRFLQPQGPYLGELSPWRFRSFTNTSALNPLFSLRIGFQL